MKTIMLCSESRYPLLALTLPRILDFIDPVIYCCGNDLTEKISVFTQNVIQLPYSEGGNYHTKEFQNFISLKLDILISELQNDSVFFLDTDIIVIKNPIDQIDTECTECDIYCQNDYNDQARDWGNVICTGCWWIRNIQSNIDLLVEARDRVINSENITCDQKSINYLRKHKYQNILVKYAPLDIWVNGFNIEKYSNPGLIHYNGIGKYKVDDKLKLISAYMKK